MMIMIYNTLTRKKEAFETIEPGKVRMYVCGPTVYDRAHVGHAMSSVVFDVIRRYLEYRGYQVRHVMNYTDVEDKIIQRAQERGVEPGELAGQYLQQYDQHLRDLNVLPATVNPRASQEMDQILAMVQGLMDRGFAYQVDGDVYFRVGRDPDYGKLSRRRLEDMRAGARLEVDERKEDPADFALWKAAKPGEPFWGSPWGPGRPGWHIECSAMNLRYLGEQIDIHGGGNDLVFPHHENEIAQSESFTDRPFARYWIHNGMLQLGGEKMSKSLGNLITIDEFLEKHSSDVFRMVVLNSSYRGPLTFTAAVLEQATSALERLHSGLRASGSGEAVVPPAGLELQARAQDAIRGFEAAMDDDFNTAGALSQLFELVRAIHQGREAGADVAAVESAQATLRRLAGVLGLRLERTEAGATTTGPLVELLIELRLELRQAGLYPLADRIRQRLAELGIVLEDGKQGTTWRLS
ncbi:MAG: cysteine--tRNA ligase [Anaerolineales bacterium]|nr:cysteine--tRNA ligase [Anaerolineales bacterium]